MNRISPTFFKLKQNHNRTANVPDVELETVMHERLDVKPLSRHNVINIFVRQLLKNSGFSSVIKAEHKDARLRVSSLQPAQESQEAHFSFVSMTSPRPLTVFFKTHQSESAEWLINQNAPYVAGCWYCTVSFLVFYSRSRGCKVVCGRGC